jgi:hypothetical protein
LQISEFFVHLELCLHRGQAVDVQIGDAEHDHLDDLFRSVVEGVV